MSSKIVNVLLLLIDFLNKSIYIKLKDIHFGFSTEEELRNLNKVSSTCAKAFKKEAAIVIISIVKSCQENYLSYCLVRTADVFDPGLMVSSTPLHLRSKIKKLLTHLVLLKVISTNLSEKEFP